VREAIERAWFEEQPVRVTYVDKDFIQTTRDVRVRAVVMDRHETRLDTEDVVTGERRPYRLDRITRAEVVEPVAH
jgi:predicted DNA-binding transcriptional regulator YafY